MIFEQSQDQHINTPCKYNFVLIKILKWITSISRYSIVEENVIFFEFYVATLSNIFSCVKLEILHSKHVKLL